MPKGGRVGGEDGLVDFMFTLTDELREKANLKEADAAKIVRLAVERIQGKYGSQYVYVKVSDKGRSERNDEIQKLKGIKTAEEVAEMFELTARSVRNIWGGDKNKQERLRERNTRIIAHMKDKPASKGFEEWALIVGSKEGVSTRQIRNIYSMAD